jgi:8-hydroxy-5-deazaflavin:NADPH oxidoreductase
MKVGILGTGNVARQLAEGLLRARHTVKLGSRDPAGATNRIEKLRGRVDVVPLSSAVAESEVIILAVPYAAVESIVRRVGAQQFKAKTVVDATNVVDSSGRWVVGHDTSGAEEIARLVPEAHVIKAFNTILAPNLAGGRIENEPLSALIAGDDDGSKAKVLQLAGDIGFDAIDAGDLRSARYLEPMAIQLLRLRASAKLGTSIGFRLATGSPPSPPGPPVHAGIRA